MGDRYPAEILDDWSDDGTMPANVEELAEVVIGHKIVSAGYEEVKSKYNNCYGSTTSAFVLTLDNGKKVSLEPTGDCCAYTDLEGFFLDPSSVDHVILGVGTTDVYSTWHIYADFGDICELQVGWSAGNVGYYGYGFAINVIDVEA